MRRLVIVLLALICLAGCSGSKSEDQTITTQTGSPTLTEVLPGIPEYPGATESGANMANLAHVRVLDKPTVVLSWYNDYLSKQGWGVVPSAVSVDNVLLLQKEGQYLSVSAQDTIDGNTVVYLHLRSTPEITEDEAIQIADDLDGSPVKWIATYSPQFEYGGKTSPVWIVKGQDDSTGVAKVVVYVDAVTAQPFRVNTIN